MAYDTIVEDEEAISRIESYHQAHYYDQLTDCVACLFGKQFTAMETKVWNGQLQHLYKLNETFLDDIITQAKSTTKTEQGLIGSAIASTAHWLGNLVSNAQNILPFNLGNLPVFDSVKLITQLTEVVFSISIHKSITSFLVNRFKLDSNKGQEEAELILLQSLEENSPFSKKIIDESHKLSNKLFKLFMFREMLLQGKITNEEKEPTIKESFLKMSNLASEKEDKIAAIIEIFFVLRLNSLFEECFKDLFDFQQQLIKIEEQKNEFDKWLGRLFESNESRHFFSRQIQLQFMKGTRDFFLQKQNQKSLLSKHPYLFSLAIALTVSLLAISIIALIGPAISTLALVSSGISAFALTLTTSILIITKLNRVFYARSPKQREQIQRYVDILNQNIFHIDQAIENSKKTPEKEINWLEKFQAINGTLISPQHILLGYHASWAREYAARYRHAKSISTDLKVKIVKLMKESRAQTKKLITSFLKKKSHTWRHYIKDTRLFINHSANQNSINAFELRLKIREQMLHIVSKLGYTPHPLSCFYEEILGGQPIDLAYIQRFYEWHNQPYKRLCSSAQRLYREKETSVKEPMRFYGEADYRKMLNLPSFTSQPNIKPCDISTYLRNSLHFLLLLTQPFKPGKGLDPLTQPIQPYDEYFVYRMIWFRELAKLYFKDTSPNDQSNRLYIESFVKRFFNLNAAEIFDDIVNQSYYMPPESTYPTITIGDQTYSREQLDYIFDSITLDIACHSKTITPHHILTCYSHDFQEAKGSRVPIKLIALNLSQSDLSIQQSEAYEKYIIHLLNDTQGFIRYLKVNNIPASYIECYQFNVIEQLINLQLDIIIKTNHSKSHPDNYSLINLWSKIDTYLSSQPYTITPNSAFYRLFNAFRLSRKGMYSFALPNKRINEFRGSIKDMLLAQRPTHLIPSFWTAHKTSKEKESSAIALKNLENRLVFMNKYFYPRSCFYLGIYDLMFLNTNI